MSDNALRFATARRQSRAQLFASWLDGGQLEAYTAPVPDHAGIAITTQTRMAVFTLPNPVGEVADGVITGDAIAPAVALAGGDVAFVRAVDAAGNAIADGDAERAERAVKDNFVETDVRLALLLSK